jgi:hypothetical protein
MDRQSPLLKQVHQIAIPEALLTWGLRVLTCAFIVSALFLDATAQVDADNPVTTADKGSKAPGNILTAPGQPQDANKSQLNTGPQAQPRPTIQSIPSIQERESISPRP